jgi:hypothetical protein
MKTYSLQEAIETVPALGATKGGPNTSKKYQFVSTRNILEHVLENGWNITQASAQGRSPYAQHRVTLVHDKDLSKLSEANPNQDGILRAEIFNAHNRSKRFMMALGYFRFACSNGLLVATGPADQIRTKHRFSDGRLESIMEQITQLSDRFPKVLEIIEGFKSRQLTESEQRSFAEFAIKGRYLYRQSLPKSFGDIDKMSNLLLTPRRKEDEDNTTWEVYNRVQENIVKGVEGITRPLRGYGDSVRVNQLLWKGAETALQYNNKELNKRLMDILVKDKKKNKISN